MMIKITQMFNYEQSYVYLHFKKSVILIWMENKNMWLLSNW